MFANSFKKSLTFNVLAGTRSAACRSFNVNLATRASGEIHCKYGQQGRGGRRGGAGTAATVLAGASAAVLFDRVLSGEKTTDPGRVALLADEEHRAVKKDSEAVVTDRKFRFAGIQMRVTGNKDENLAAALSLIRAAVTDGGAQVVSLGECFNCPYSTDCFREYGERVPDGPSSQALAKTARELGIYLIAGSLPELDGDKVYNTSVVFDPQGQMIAKHRKVHLFDIDIPGKITFQESKTLSAGDGLTVFNTRWGNMGLAICYDMRFPMMAQIAADQDAIMMIYPGAFNTTTGPMHWELLQRARAVDNQMFVATVSPARALTSEGYQAWGHSTVVDPWGKLLATTEHDPDTVFADIDLDVLDEVRANIPIRTQRRTDLYSVSAIKQ